MLTEGWDANNVTHILGMRTRGPRCAGSGGSRHARTAAVREPAIGRVDDAHDRMTSEGRVGLARANDRPPRPRLCDINRPATSGPFAESASNILQAAAVLQPAGRLAAGRVCNNQTPPWPKRNRAPMNTRRGGVKRMPSPNALPPAPATRSWSRVASWLSRMLKMSANSSSR